MLTADKQPLVSIVICTKNSESTIRKSIDSIFNLNYRNYEIIVVDWDSTDRTLEIMSEYPVRIFDGKRKGIAYQRNVGWKEAMGEFILYFDSDMWVSQTDYIQSFLKYFKNPGVAGVVNNLLVDPELSEKSIVARLENYRLLLIATTLPSKRYRIATGGSMFRRSVLAEAGGFDERFSVGSEDTEISIKLNTMGYLLLYAPDIVAFHARVRAFRAKCKSLIIGGYWNQMLYEKYKNLPIHYIEVPILERFLDIKRLKIAFQIFREIKDPIFLLTPLYHILCLTFLFAGRLLYKLKHK